MVQGRRGFVILSLALLLPVAMAASVKGSLRADGTLVFPGSTVVEGSGLALAPAADVDSLSFTAALVEFRLFERRSIGLPGEIILRTDLRETSWRNTNVVANLNEQATWGFVGLSKSTFTLTADSTETVDARQSSTISSDAGFSPDEWQRPTFFKVVNGPHAYLKTSGVINAGPSELKILGPSLRFTAAENATPVDLRTGRFQTSPTEVVYRWAVVIVYEGVVSLSSAADIEAAIGEVTTSWNGTLSFTPTQGTLSGDSMSYSATGSPATLTGVFTADLIPTPGKKGSFELVDLQGELTSTNLNAHSIQSPAPVVNRWILIGVPIAVVLGIGGVAIVGHQVRHWKRQHRRNDVSWSLADCMDGFQLALQNAQLVASPLSAEGREDVRGELERALLWAKRGQDLAPEDPYYVTAEATALCKLGRMEEAWAKLEAAHDLAQDGSAALEGAFLMQRAGCEPPRVQEWCARAVEKQPDLLDTVEEAFRDYLDWGSQTEPGSWVVTRTLALKKMRRRS